MPHKIEGEFNEEYSISEDNELVTINQYPGHVIVIPKPYFEEFVQWLQSQVTNAFYNNDAENDEYKDMIKSCAESARNMSHWETTFINDLFDLFERGEAKNRELNLSRKQKEIINRIYNEKCK